MDIENNKIKVLLKSVENFKDSNKNMINISSSLEITNKSEKDIFVSVKYSYSDDVTEFEISANKVEKIKADVKISNDINTEDISLNVKAYSNDDKNILNHSFGIGS